MSVYGGWQPLTTLDLAECAADPYITQAGVTPDWVLKLRAALASPEICTCGHFPARRACDRCRKTKVSGPEAGCSTATPPENRNRETRIR